MRGNTHGFEKLVSHLLFIPIALIALVLGFYWFSTNSVVENLVVDQPEFFPTPKLENNSIEAISVSRESQELNQLQQAYSKPIDPAKDIRVNTLDSFIDADDHSYQRDNSEPINVGEVKDADDYSYQRNNSEPINVGEVKDADDTSYQRDDRELIKVGEIMDVQILD